MRRVALSCSAIANHCAYSCERRSHRSRHCLRSRRGTARRRRIGMRGEPALRARRAGRRLGRARAVARLRAAPARAASRGEVDEARRATVRRPRRSPASSGSAARSRYSSFQYRRLTGAYGLGSHGSSPCTDEHGEERQRADHRRAAAQRPTARSVRACRGRRSPADRRRAARTPGRTRPTRRPVASRQPSSGAASSVASPCAIRGFESQCDAGPTPNGSGSAQSRAARRPRSVRPRGERTVARRLAGRVRAVLVGSIDDRERRARAAAGNRTATRGGVAVPRTTTGSSNAVARRSASSAAGRAGASSAASRSSTPSSCSTASNVSSERRALRPSWARQRTSMHPCARASACSCRRARAGHGRAPSRSLVYGVGLQQPAQAGDRDPDPVGPVVELVADLVQRLLDEVRVELDTQRVGVVRQRGRSRRSRRDTRAGTTADTHGDPLVRAAPRAVHDVALRCAPARVRPRRGSPCTRRSRTNAASRRRRAAATA